ncbi:MAG: hypothetical protein ACI9CO_000004 [Candidatus Azotimanducaceae bacterium]|jgi:hypothetical protein
MHSPVSFNTFNNWTDSLTTDNLRVYPQSVQAPSLPVQTF